GWALWDLEGECSLPLPDRGGREEAPPTAAAWSPDGRWVVVGGADGRCEVLAFPGLRRLHRPEGPAAADNVAVSPDGPFLALARWGARLGAAGEAGFHTALTAPAGRVTGRAFTRKADRLATACADDRARAFLLPEVPGPAARLFEPVGHLPIG